MLDFLKSLIGGRPSALTIDQTDIAEVSLDLKVLDSVDPGLGKRATDYVLTGEGGSVLLELEQRKGAVNPVFSHYHYQNPNKEGLAARQRVLTRHHEPEASWLRRYGEVLSVQHTGSRWGIGGHQGPSPPWLRRRSDSRRRPERRFPVGGAARSLQTRSPFANLGRFKRERIRPCGAFYFGLCSWFWSAAPIPWTGDLA